MYKKEISMLFFLYFMSIQKKEGKIRNDVDKKETAIVEKSSLFLFISCEISSNYISPFWQIKNNINKAWIILLYNITCLTGCLQRLIAVMYT